MKKSKAKPDNPEQSRRFMEGAKALEAAGDLSLTEADAAFDAALDKVAKKKPDDGAGSH